jgi:polar amino acid transport system substrate-binding protein
MKIASVIIWFVLFTALIPVSGSSEVVTIVSDCWTPYICGPEAGKNGIAVDICKTVFKKAGYNLEFKIVPWKRAIVDTRKGKYDAIVCATKNDAPDFVYPEEPIAVQKTCFYTDQNSSWKYENIDSLSGIILGVIGGYHYSKELDKYIEEKGNTGKVQVAQGNNPLRSNVFMLKKQRISALIEDPLVMQYYIWQNKEAGLREAGCVPERVKLFIPFSPEKSKAELYAKILSDGIKELIKSGDIKLIYKSYGIEWQE